MKPWWLWIVALETCVSALRLESLEVVRLAGLGSYRDRPAVMVARGFDKVVPVLVAPEVVSCLRYAYASVGRPSRGALADRDGGFLDNAPWDDASVTKRSAYDVLKFGRPKILFQQRPVMHPYEVLLDVATEAFGQLVGCVVEDAWPGDDRAVLEGAIQFQDEDQTERTIDCFADEAVGLALVSGCPLRMRRDTYESLATGFDLDGNGAVVARFDGKEASSLQRDDREPQEVVKSGAEYLALPTNVKVALLERANKPLPRPRRMREDPRGYDALLDDQLLPLVDEIVRREVLIETAITRGDFAAASKLMAAKSERHKAYDRANDASEAGDLLAELDARNQKSLFDATKADITQDDDAYSRFLDRDPWYEDQLRRNRENQARSVSSPRNGGNDNGASSSSGNLT
mmetsp:Transcript_28323/g.86816  ORF Transcript_28323/g.86816 Transcript_28323/m.86816 type:complete len:403 (+) Transcript_28323:419-1627(+)